MRVTQGMLTSHMLRNLRESYDRMDRTQQQLMTGKKINRPSDDPVIAMKGMDHRTQLGEVEQYKRNLSEAINWSESTDNALEKATSVLQRVRELTVQASNGTYEGSQREAIAKEIYQLREHLASIANTQLGDQYMFNGTKTDVAPVDLKANKYPSATSELFIELSKGVTMNINVQGQTVFPESLFKDLEALDSELRGAGTTPINAFLTKLDQHLQSVVTARSDLGARQNRLELIENRVDEQEVVVNRILSNTEDADIERVITDLKMQESIQRAALSVGSRIIQPSLLDFLR
ncbi:flagellar hook-associated protein FlgL [Fictibacillus macauensis ZFHKF-1]|uniref:Flagellar hook-associated protein FlgL n=1 Tax=Fictibacillus macauensis ZFHKF-1 TaxID=1196324 RepID=I8J560_9BACL|nr:flagellar hook-associated protein FlgL [Fictibacillus macauensis]EIT86941.1 flagellar hook-associated protein FlgL [Fictibacillus macauensis ZFHKF-1]